MAEDGERQAHPAIDASAGAISGAARGTGLDDSFVRKLGTDLPPGHAVVVLLAGEVDQAGVLKHLHGQYDGRILQTSLPPEAEDQLRAAVAAARTSG